MLLKQSGFPGCLGFRGDLICAGGHGLALVSAEAVAMPVSAGTLAVRIWEAASAAPILAGLAALPLPPALLAPRDTGVHGDQRRFAHRFDHAF